MNMKLIFSLLFFIILGQFVLAQERYKSLVYEGNRQFDKKNYDASSSKFLEAAKLDDKNFDAHYNLGNALYKKKMYEEAKAEFQKAEKTAKNKNDKAAAQYNLGNAMMQTQKMEQAAEMYKKALKNDPYNESIRKNYEIAKLKEKDKDNKKDQNQDNKGGDQKDKNQQGGQDNKGDQKGNQPNGESNDKQQQSGKGAEDKQSSQEPKESGSKIPKDIENAILNKVQDREKETARRILNKDANSIPQSNEKDW